MKKSKYSRRRAIDCKIVEKSKKYPGYCKYIVTIAELDDKQIEECKKNARSLWLEHKKEP